MEKNYILNTLELAGNKAKYDAQVKKILCDRRVLAWIMKYSVSEFADAEIETIMNAIEGNPEISVVPVYPGKHRPDAIIGMQTEDSIPNEGEITYDIRFYAITPNKEQLKLIINIEAQKKYNPGYDLVPRALFN